MDKKKKVVIGTRGSKLALIQADWVKSQLEKSFQDTEFIIEKIKTTGDKITDVPLAKIGGVGLFTKELENALLEKKVDIVVHSAKDLQTDIPEGLAIGAYVERKDPHDALISKDNLSLRDLPQGTKIGTSSLRRRSQILAFRPDIEVVDMRGNLDTRLKKIDAGELDAIVVAMAGLIRFDLPEKASEIISYDIMLPAVGQGALCIEIRDGDLVIEKIVSVLNHHDTRFAVRAERALLGQMQGGCQVPVGAHAEIIYPVNIKIEAVVCSLDGKTVYRDSAEGKVDDCEILGQELANKLMGMGGYHIMSEIRKGLA